MNLIYPQGASNDFALGHHTAQPPEQQHQEDSAGVSRSAPCRNSSLVLFALLIPAAFSHAQPLPDAGSLLRQQEQLEQTLPQAFPEVEAPEALKPAMQAEPGVKVRVKSIRFSGAIDLVPESELDALMKHAIGEELDFAGLQALAARLTEHLRSRGWLLARAYLPQQDVTGGTIEIAILKGRLDGAAGEGGGWKVTLNEDARIDPARLARIAEAAAPSGNPVRQEELERALLLINDLPGVNARARLEPGSATGTTRILVDANEGALFTGNLWADNNGNHSTGEAQLNATLNLNDPGGYGDHASLGLTASEGIQLVRLGYSAPLNSRGLRASAGYTDMRYEVKNGTGVAAGLEGHSRIARVGLNYPFIRTRALSLYGSVDYHRKSLTDDSKAGTLRDKRIDAFSFGLSGDSLDHWQGGGFNNFGLSATHGNLDLSRVAADRAADAATLRTQGSYTKLNLNASRLQRLPGHFTLLGRISAQLADGNLDSSEEFILGGPNGVRAYPVGEAQGDEGWLASAELRYDWPGGTPLGALQLSAFADTGGIRTHKKPGSVAIPTATARNAYQLSGAGLGVSLSKPGSYSVRLSWAHTLGSNPGRSVTEGNADGKTDNHRFWLQAVLWF